MRRLVFSLLVFVGCFGPGGRDAGDDVDPDADTLVEPLGTGEFDGLPTGIDQWKRLCRANYGGVVAGKFCQGTEPPTIRSLAELQTFLGFHIGDRDYTRVVFTGLSTGVGLRTVTPLNPRAILISPPSPLGQIVPTFTIMSFARGEPLVELIAGAYDDLQFFVLRFNPACESQPTGCNYADLLTPSIESDWTGYTLYDEATIKNTPLDCLACHQPNGPGTYRLLRMQEARVPWNHWFASNFTSVPNNREEDFHVAHGGELYAGVSSDNIESPQELENFLRATGNDFQPNEYDSFAIMSELVHGSSPTWEKLYERAVTGEAIPPPYYGVDQTDPAKVAAMTAAYQQVMAGTLARDQLPDIRDTLLESALPAMSIRPKQGIDGRGMLVHICSRCHNSRLDQTQSRARFNVETLDTLSRAEKDYAILRLQLSDDDPHKMPPPRFHVLTTADRDLMIEALSQ